MGQFPSLPRKLALTALPAAACFTAPADAQVIVTDLPDHTITPSSGEQIYFSINTGAGGTAESSLSEFSGWQFRLTYDAGSTQKPEVRGAPGASVSAVSSGQLIDTSLHYATDFVDLASSESLLALRVESAAGTTFAWAALALNTNLDGTFVSLHTIATNSVANQGLYAGTDQAVIPEPSTYAALAGLLAGSAVLYQRRRKKSQA